MNRPFAVPMLVAFSLCALAAVAHAEDRVRIVNEGGIRDQWMLADGIKLAAPGYPAAFAERGDNVCVAIGYAIKPDGTTSDFTAAQELEQQHRRQGARDGFWDAFAQAGAGALSQWKFKPRPEVDHAAADLHRRDHALHGQAGDGCRACCAAIAASPTWRPW